MNLIIWSARATTACRHSPCMQSYIKLVFCLDPRSTSLRCPGLIREFYCITLACVPANTPSPGIPSRRKPRYQCFCLRPKLKQVVSNQWAGHRPSLLLTVAVAWLIMAVAYHLIYCTSIIIATGTRFGWFNTISLLVCPSYHTDG